MSVLVVYFFLFFYFYVVLILVIFVLLSLMSRSALLLQLRSLLGSELWQTRCMAQFLAFAVPAVSWTPDSCLVLSFGGLAV